MSNNQIKQRTVIAATEADGLLQIANLRERRKSAYWLDAPEYDGATLVADFKNWLFAICEYPGGPLVEKTFSDIFNHTRTGVAATDWDNQGNLVQYAASTPRRGYNTTSLASLGLMCEEGTTNFIRNNTMQGAGAGVAPTNWSIAGGTGITATVVGKTTIKGVVYLDVRYSGTSSAAGGAAIFMEASNGIAATNATTYTVSAYLALIAGSMANVTGANLNCVQYSAGLADLGSAGTNDIKAALTGSVTRFQTQCLTNQATIAYIRPRWNFSWSSGAVIDFTVRVALPQLEAKGYATSPVVTTGSAQTRGDETTTLTNMLWFEKLGGIFVVEYEACSALKTECMPFALDTSGTQARAHLGVNGGNIGFYMANSAGSQISPGYANADVEGVISRVAMAYNQRPLTGSGVSLLMAKNGVLLGETLGSMGLDTFTPNRLTVGYRQFPGGRGWLNEHVGKLVFYPNAAGIQPTEGTLSTLSTVSA